MGISSNREGKITTKLGENTGDRGSKAKRRRQNRRKLWMGGVNCKEYFFTIFSIYLIMILNMNYSKAKTKAAFKVKTIIIYI